MKQKQFHKQERRSSSLLLKMFALVAFMLCSVNGVWAQDASFTLNQYTGSYKDNGETITFDGGGADDVHSGDNGYTDLRKNASIIFSGNRLRYVRITFNDNNNYTLKWGGAWSESELNANNTTSGTGSVILTSNSGTPFLKILNEGDNAVPIKKIDVFYFYDGCADSGNQGTSASGATKTVDNFSCVNNTIPLDKINVVGTKSSFNASNGKGILLNESGDHYLSIKFNGEVNLGDLSTFKIEGTNVDKTQGGVFNQVQFICTDGNVDKYNNPSNTDFTAAQLATLQKTKEIRLYNATLEGSFTISSIKLNFNSNHVKSTPVLNNGTTASMSITVGEALTLSATNGYWREFTDNTYSTEKNYAAGSPIPDNRWNPEAPFDGNTLSKLSEGTHYFGIKDASWNCTPFGQNHSSELVKMVVTVRKALKTIDVNGTTREYDVYAPNGISGTVGVIFSLHGASNDYDNGRVDFNEIADANWNTDNKKFVVVYPRGLMRELRGTERGWDSYTEDGVEDVEFFKAVVNNLNQTFNGQFSIDYNRIYLAGFSNGGMMAYKAAHQAGDFFAACASVAGYPVNESHLFHAGVKPVPFVHIQGKADGVFPSATYPVDVIVHNMVYRNGAEFNPLGDGGMVADNSNVTKDCHNAEAGGAAYYMYKVANMDHTPSYDWTGDSKDDVASTMWAFFNKSGITNNVDPTLKFRIYDATYFWNLAGDLGFDNKDNGTSVLSYGGRKTTGKNQTPYDKDTKNNNLWHSLQFEGGVNGAPHYLKLNVHTELTSAEDPNQFFLVKLTKTGETTPVFAKRYQAGRGTKDLYINFSALPDFNEYKLEITKSSSDLVVKVHGVEFHTGKCQDVGATENPTAFYDVAAVLDGMNPIYQPVYGTSFDGIAREYLPIADIPVGGDPKTIENDLKVNGTAISSLPSTLITDWKGATTATIDGQQFLNIAVSGRSDEYIQNKSKNACILVRDDSHSHNYTIDKTKGINISQFGRAEMPEYLNGTRATFPTHGVLAMKFQGTLDFTLLAQNDVEYTDNANTGRRTLKVYYTNDQMDGEFKELKEWWFFNTRSEVYGNDGKGNTLAPLSASIRLPHLGKDGTCTVLITYEGAGRGSSFSHADSDNDKMWIKGFVIKRPDLKVTIGRTDSNYSGQTYGGENNTKLTRFGENKPYIWSFENVGFNNTKNSDLDVKKINEKDWRTYICGGTEDSWDHLLVYSNLDSEDNNDKAQFDGRVAGQEHIEFRAASNYRMKDDPTASDNGRMEFNPILSNGLKLNVTGSGWFKIKCSAPNGPVNMKVYSSTNYGITYTNLLREFRVEKTASDVDWQEYTVYLKGHVNRTATNPKGFWDGTPSASKDEAANAEEIIRMSLYVVYDEIPGTTYDESHPQLNIHQLSWLNEEPADYVFQREEDPKLLTEWQTINRDGNVVLYWKAGNDDDAQYPILKENGQSTYKVTGQITTDIATKGVKSPGGKASVTVPSDAGTYDAYWDISAKPQTNAHTETAYANGKKDFVSANEYKNVSSRGNTEFDIPISGSFIRICAMKNTYVVAHVLPGTVDLNKTGAANGSGADGKSDAAVYVLDETGAPIPYKANGADLDDEANKHGYVSYMQNFDGGKDGGAKSNGGTMRIDFAANAGKEYFICAKDASISLARLEVQDWRYKPTKSSTKLELTDNANNSTTISNAYDTKEFYRDAKLTRSFTKDKWASLVLPFSMNEKKFEEVFGTGAKCLHFTEVDRDTKTVYLTHHYYNMIVAGRPVFVLPTQPVTNAEIADVTLQAKEVRSTTSANGFEFVPSYDNATIYKNDLYMNNENAIQYLSAASATYPGMRSFIKSKDFNPGGSAKAMFFDFDEEEGFATGIDELIASEFGDDVIVVTKSTKVYDLNGRMVTEGKDINSLPAGIYIVNGKKYIVK